MKRPAPLPLLLLLATTLHCQRTETHQQRRIEPAVYYWETTANWGFRWDSLSAAGVGKVYLRLFDVAWDERTAAPVPVSPYRDALPWPDSVPTVPVVFITNETLQQLDSAGCIDLARRIDRKAAGGLDAISASVEKDAYWNRRWDGNRIALRDEQLDSLAQRTRTAWRGSIGELQIDCDWSVSTRDKFFALLTELRRLAPARRLSATIRLHQFRHFDKTGVPPVDRGMLMVYNVGNVRDPDTENSIFSFDAVRPYLDGAEPYPLPLDVALPAFRWGVLFHLGKFVAIVPAHVFEENRANFRPAGGNRFTATSDFVMLERYIREGDMVRWEEADPAELLRVIGLLRRQPLADPLTVSFFHATASYDHAAQQRFFETMLAAFR